MQQTEQQQELATPAPTEPISESLHLIPAEADEIFRLAEAEIKPLLRQARRDKWTGWVQTALCLCLMLGSIGGMIWQLLTLPKTVVTIFPVERPVSITTALNIPLRTLAPVTITRTASAAATGHGHQDARSAVGTLTFYNGLFTAQTIPSGTVFTGSDGVKIATIESITIPQANPTANPPQFVGVAPVHAYAVQTGAAGNIAAYDINAQYSNGVSVKNTSAFENGRDARDYKAVAPYDIQSLTSTLKQTLTQKMLQAFQLAPGEALALSHCLFAFTPDHQPGDEAATVTLKSSSTCQGHAYNAQEVTNRAMIVFTSTQPDAHYQLFGTVQAHVTNVTPLIASVSGIWVYTFTKDYEESLAEHIAGDTPVKAKAYLLKTGVIAQATIPTTLPDAMYIKFVVLISL